MSRSTRRLVVICPMRSHCETVRVIFENGDIPTYLAENFADDLAEMARLKESWGIVAGTGTGKTVFIRQVAQTLFGKDFTFDVVNREEESTPKTWEKDVLVVTTGVAMHYLKAGIIDDQDKIIIDEIHQTSEHLEVAMALAKHKGIMVSWMSATIDPEVYAEYFGTEKILSCTIRDPDKRARVHCLQFDRRSWGRGYSSPGVVSTHLPAVQYYMEERGGLAEIVRNKRGVAVFVPTRREAEQYAEKYAKQPGLYVDFYHGGELASKLRDFLTGQIPQPFIIFMTAAGSSSLNIVGLDTVIIQDETYREVIYSGVKVLEKVKLSTNDLLQMAGRVDGRVKGSRVVILSERSIDYTTLKPEIPKFVLGGDLEQVALTCARLEIELDELNPIGEIDLEQYKKVRQMLEKRGLIDEDGSLTDYGKKCESLPISRVWAEYLVNTKQRDLFLVILVVSCIPSLYNLLRRKGEHKIEDLIIEGNDFLTAYSIIEEVINNDSFSYIYKDKETGDEEYRLTKDFYAWSKESGVSPKAVKETLLAIRSVCKSVKSRLLTGLPVISPQNDLEDRFNALLLDVQALDIVSRIGQTADHRSVFPSTCSQCGTKMGNTRQMKTAMIGLIRPFKNARGITLHSIEGLELSFDDIEDNVEKGKAISVRTSDDGSQVTIEYQICAFGFQDFMRVPASYDRLPERFEQEFARQAKAAFIEWLATHCLDKLTAEESENNKTVLEEVKRLRQIERPLGFATESMIAKERYERLLARHDVYTVPMAREAGIDLKLRMDMFYSRHQIERLERRRVEQTLRGRYHRRW